MRNRLAAAALTATMAVGVFGAQGASAATEFGDNCVANGGAPNYTFVGLNATGNPLSLTAPTSGVITRWKSNVGLEGPVEGSLSMSMVVLRSVGGLQFTVVGQTPSSPIVNGANSFPARVPVQAGDRIGLSSFFAPLYCQTLTEADVMGIVPAPLGQGATASFEPTNGYRVPVAALIEPDADNDGFGDETQDGCPISAAVQTACPLVTVEATSAVGRNAVTVLVTTSSLAPVQVTGTVKIGKGKTVTLKTPAKAVTPGTLAKFKLGFKKKLRDRLKELTPKQKLTLKITATATNVAGQVSADKLNAKLKGQG